LDRVKEELADILIYSITLAERLELDINTIIIDKIKKNGVKYPTK
jgi:NTP pyrophosphatase (non-canonical NTP hydrolase)